MPSYLWSFSIFAGARASRLGGGQDPEAGGERGGEERGADAAQPAPAHERGAQHAPVGHRRQAAVRVQRQVGPSTRKVFFKSANISAATSNS